MYSLLRFEAPCAIEIQIKVEKGMVTFDPSFIKPYLLPIIG